MNTAEKLSTGPSRTRARGLDVDGNINITGNSLRPRAYACTWREACKAADYVLEHFGNPLRDRGIWVWYCQRLGLNQFLDLADEVISSARQGEVKSPKTTQTHCRRRIHLPKAIAKRRLRWCPKHLCALLAPPLWLINFVLPQRGHREAQRFLELGLRPKPQTHCRRQPKTSLRPPCALSVANQLCLATKGAQRGTKVFRVGAPPQTPDHDAGKRGAK